jgi:hypothetical protein
MGGGAASCRYHRVGAGDATATSDGSRPLADVVLVDGLQ